jgi:nitric oxide reductase NorE protein
MGNGVSVSVEISPPPAIAEGAVREAREELPGDFAMWIFIFAELLVFGVFFLGYASARARNVELFNTSQLQADRMAGTVNTLLLVTSSWLVARAVHAIRAGRAEACARWLMGAIGLGGGFLVVKGVEYTAKFDAGISLSTNTFWMFYLSLTFFHFMHVILGMVILAAVLLKAGRGGYTAAEHRGVETGASYWHMVDLVWIILFPLVYVVR